MGRYITSTSEKIKPEGLSKTRQVYPGDLVLSNSMSFGRPYIMAVEGCIHDGWLLIRDTQNQFDPVFLCHMLGTPQMLDQYRMFASGSTVNNLNKELVGNATVPIPNRNEQVEIGKYLDELDSLITLHQRECGKASFARPLAWEQRKLREICEVNPTTVLPDSFEYVDLESVVGTDMISHRREEKLTAPSRAQRLASFGDIFYQTVRPYQKNNYFYELPDRDYVFSTGYAQLRPLCDGRFLFSSLQREQFVSCVLEHCTGTSYPAINANDLAALPLAVPNDIEEQRLVGSILKPIDILITLHQ